MTERALGAIGVEDLQTLATHRADEKIHDGCPRPEVSH
jgi:hypothetical protein